MNNDLKNLLLTIVLLAVVLIAHLSFGQGLTDHEDFVHLTAHVGASYAINTFSYGLWSRAFKCSRTDAVILAAVTTFMIGAIYKGVEFGTTPAEVSTAFERNLIGIGLSAGTIFLFSF